jgi:hypothetical protein
MCPDLLLEYFADHATGKGWPNLHHGWDGRIRIPARLRQFSAWHKDHPFGWVRKVCEVRIIARISHVEIDREVDRTVALLQGFAVGVDAEQLANSASSPITR